MALLARPPCLPPTPASTHTSRMPTVILRHPGYGTGNILFTLPAVDVDGSRPGLHQRTLLTAAAIIANNAFDRVYLTYDRAGRDRVDATLSANGLLEPGEYWLQLNGHELFRSDRDGLAAAATATATATTVISSMAPPPPRPTSTFMRNPPTAIPPATSPTDSTAQATSPHIPYPVVPSFGDWQFPHDLLPKEWTQCGRAPPTPPQHTTSTVSRRCWVSGYHMGINECHLVPKNQEAWWDRNDMRRYTRNTGSGSRDLANLALLRADIHDVLDAHKFAIVPKPSSTSCSMPGLPLDSTPDEHCFSFAAHVLQTDDEAREFSCLYQNISLAQPGVDKLSPEFLFARFAWAIFSHLQLFLHSFSRRHLAVIIQDEAEAEAGSFHTELKHMNGEELTRYLNKRGVTRSGSKTRKRSSSQMTQDDCYQERWQRRNHSVESSEASSEGSADDLDPEMKQVRRNTRWHEKVGQFSRGDLEQEQIDRNTRWYEDVERFSRGGLEQEQTDHCTRWHEDSGHLSRAGSAQPIEQNESDASDDDLACGHGSQRGRSRRRKHIELGSSPLGSEGMPNLSRSFTTHGSDRSSSTFADVPGETEGGPGLGFEAGSGAPDDKVHRAASGARPHDSPQVDGNKLSP